MKTIRVAVIGATGRMGSTVCEAVENAPDLELVARISEKDPIDASTINNADVAVEFSVPTATCANVHALIKLGVHVVVGTSGWTKSAEKELEDALCNTSCNVLIAPNFALGAVLLMKFAAEAARFYESVEIIEMHHPNKVDAPSGTAIATAQRIAQSRASADCAPAADATQTDPHGARGATYDGVPIHAIRLRGLYAHQEVLLGNPGEQLVLRSDCFDRQAFMPGVLYAIRCVGDHPGLTVGLDRVMNHE